MIIQYTIEFDIDARTITVSGNQLPTRVYHDASMTFEADIETMPDCNDVTKLYRTGRQSFTIEGEIK